MISSECEAQIRKIIPLPFMFMGLVIFHGSQGHRDSRVIPLDAFSTNYPRQNSKPKTVCFSTCMCASESVCVCLSSLRLRRQFEGRHIDEYNDQWQSELQLRAGTSVPSQPITGEMLRDRKGQAEPLRGRRQR